MGRSRPSDDVDFDALVRANKARVFGYCTRLGLDPVDVDDLVADVFATAWTKRRELAVKDEHATLLWLLSVARRHAANSRRGSLRRQRLYARIGQQPRVLVTGGDQPPSLMWLALGQMRPEDVELLALSYWEELGTGDIAHLLDCTPNAAAIRLTRAKARLRVAVTALQTPQPDQTDKESYHARAR